MDAKVFSDDAMRGVSPAVNGLTVAFDDVADDFVAIEVEVWLDGCLAGLHVVEIAADVSEMTAKGRMAEQVSGSLGIDRTSALDGDFFRVERFAGTNLAAR